MDEAVLATEANRKFSAGARRVLLARLHSQPARQIGSWTREDLYEENRASVD